MYRDHCGSDQPSSSAISITVLSVAPSRANNLFAFASVEIDVDGVQIGVHGIRAMRARPDAAAIELPKFRDADGVCVGRRSPSLKRFTLRSPEQCSMSPSNKA
jgi:hypothetical protein